MIEQRFPDEVLKTLIKRTIRFPDSTIAGVPLALWDPKADGAQNYSALARELLDDEARASEKAVHG